MKVLEIISAGYAAGGAENYLLKINHYLLDKGYSLKTLASDLGADENHFNEYVFKSIPSNPLKLLFFLFNPHSFFALKRVLKEYKPDIVHLHTMNQVTSSVLFLLKKYPTVMTLHGPEPFVNELLIWFLRPSWFKSVLYDPKNLNTVGKLAYFYFNSIQKIFYKIGLKNVDIFIAPSKYIENVAKTEMLSQIVHVPYFIEPLKFQEWLLFQELKNNYNVLFVGRLEKFKGVEFIIKAIPAIIKILPQTTLTIIGDGPYKNELINLTKTLHIEDCIQFKGWIENKELGTYYSKASIVVAPSTVPEAFGLVILEAMSMGRPVIATNVGAIPEIIDNGVNGYLVEPNNSEQIAEKVIKLFLEENLLTELGRNARKKAEEFSIEKHLENLERVYTELMSKYNRQTTDNCSPPLETYQSVLHSVK